MTYTHHLLYYYIIPTNSQNPKYIQFTPIYDKQKSIKSMHLRILTWQLFGMFACKITEMMNQLSK